MKKNNLYLRIGLAFTAIFLASSSLDILPDFFEGFFAGLGISLLLVGMFKYRKSTA